MPAKLYKLATFAHSTLDALRMLLTVRHLRSKGRNVIGLCMGAFGHITRVFSPITYAHLGSPTAPGQLSAYELKNIYRYPQKEPWFGLIGDPIEQSISHLTHNKHLPFVKMQIQPQELNQALDLIKALPFQGLAVTIPHKEQVIPGQVINTLVRKGNGFIGANTDGIGALDVLGKNVQNKHIALLGAGGCASAIAKVFIDSGARLKIYNRAPKIIEGLPTKSLLKPLEPYDILINATSCGMLSTDCPLRDDQILPGKTVFETITKPEETTLLNLAKAKGCTLYRGKDLFLAQAKYQFKLWKNVNNCR